MYAYIKGTLEFTTQTEAIVEAGGVGYRIHVSPKTKSRLPDIGKEVKLFTHFAVREDAMELYGFSSAEELFVYEQVISVSGVGPKVGLAIMSAMEPDQFIAAVVTNDVKAITAAQGVGAKLAARIILELKDKMKKESADMDLDAISPSAPADEANEAVEALLAMGFTAPEAKKAVSGLSGSVEEIIGQAFKNLMRRG